MISHFCPAVSKPHSYPFTPNSKDCYLKILLQACPKQHRVVCQGSHRTALCPASTTAHTRRPRPRPPDGRAAPGTMKAVTGSSSWTSEGPGPFSAPILRATWLIPSSPELQGRPASGGRGEMDPRLPAAPVQPSGPDAGSSCAFSELPKRTFPSLRGPRHLCL